MTILRSNGRVKNFFQEIKYDGPFHIQGEKGQNIIVMATTLHMAEGFALVMLCHIR